MNLNNLDLINVNAMFYKCIISMHSGFIICLIGGLNIYIFGLKRVNTLIYEVSIFI